MFCITINMITQPLPHKYTDMHSFSLHLCARGLKWVDALRFSLFATCEYPLLFSTQTVPEFGELLLCALQNALSIRISTTNSNPVQSYTFFRTANHHPMFTHSSEEPEESFVLPSWEPKAARILV